MADRTPKEKVQVEPSPKNPALVGWLEGNFYGPGDYPQRLEVRTMYGPHHERMGPLIKQVLYPPNMMDPAERNGASSDGESNGKANEKRKAKPNREELVEMSHDILRRIQADADATGKTAVYYILLSHDLRDPQPYERFPLRVVPNTTRAPHGEEAEEEDENGGVSPIVKGYLLGMKQNQEAMQLAFSMIEGLVDRQDRMNVRAEEALEATRSQLLRQQDIVARAMDLNSERKMKEEMNTLKVEGIKRAMGVFETFVAPNLLPGLVSGKKGANIVDSSESMVLKAFLKPLDEGGSLTKQQIDAVFGAFDDEPEMNLISAGVLSVDQGKVIFDVANLKMPAAELEKLVPGGELAVSPMQFAQLQEVFKDSFEQITPLMGLFGMVMKRVQDRNNAAQQTNQHQAPQQTT